MYEGAVKRIESAAELPECLNVLNTAYLHRDERLGIDRSYKRADLTLEELEEMFDHGVQMYGCCDGDKLIALISFKTNETDIKIKDITVLPGYQGRGIGSHLMDFVKDIAREEKKDSVRLSFLYDIAELKDWYEKRGFAVIRIDEFPAARVGRMEYRIV